MWTNIKDKYPNAYGWYFCRFYDKTFGGFYVRKLLREEGYVDYVITDIVSFEHAADYSRGTLHERKDEDDIECYFYTLNVKN